jgi:hypothetical protein
MKHPLLGIIFLFLFVGLNQTLFAQKPNKNGYEIRVDAYKKIRDTALVRVQQYKNDTLLQELYCLMIPSCRVAYGLKLGKFTAFKRYYSVDVLIPHGRYSKIYPDGNWDRVFDHGVLLSSVYIDSQGNKMPEPKFDNASNDITIIENNRRCKQQEKRYYNIIQ